MQEGTRPRLIKGVMSAMLPLNRIIQRGEEEPMMSLGNAKWGGFAMDAQTAPDPAGPGADIWTIVAPKPKISWVHVWEPKDTCHFKFRFFKNVSPQAPFHENTNNDVCAC